MKHIILFSTLVFGFLFVVQAQEEHGHHHPNMQVGLQAQAYPTGFIFTIHADKIWDHHSILELRAGYNTFDHRDLGEQIDEEGDGFGGSIAYKRYLNDDLTKWVFGVRTDVWFNEVEYLVPTTILVIPPVFVMQKSEIVVLQPTLLAGYTFPLNEAMAITPEVALGMEWNIDTNGLPTGEGPIALFGVSVSHRFGK